MESLSFNLAYERLNHPLNSFTSFVAKSFFHLSVRHPARGAGTLVSLNALQPFSLRKGVKARQEKIPERKAQGLFFPRRPAGPGLALRRGTATFASKK